MSVVGYGEVVSRKARVLGKCPVCDRYMQRQTWFRQEYGPLNRNSAGLIKTREEIVAELEQQVADWKPDLTHLKCREKRS